MIPVTMGAVVSTVKANGVPLVAVLPAASVAVATAETVSPLFRPLSCKDQVPSGLTVAACVEAEPSSVTATETVSPTSAVPLSVVVPPL